ncbi:endonuclease/exonuclease/phosphatase family protein [Maribacter litoralis]|uniref:Metal-dependent hydrolase, endonuclease/exonuclease/phosphatase family n=1 Tax=Maribacter litoralis TaxID=2059726 RepID=A0A653WB17_9FLAO|nr:endonuclease/exonuclease/phosphatase family protein [Maribacter litoralis]VXC16109.1 Metal-dependent hydrolase, endonuclease/exonuclease/phosphatase family [Maribacter litoralis]
MFKKIFLPLFILIHFIASSQEQISLISWNIRDFGKTKSNEELDRMAEILRDADIVALQEVVAGYGGAQAVAKLADNLNRKGAKWDYVISNPTNSPKYVTERYAFIWKTKNIKIKNRGALIKELDSLVDREPFFLDFYVEGRKLSVINFHSRPHDKNPEREILAITDYLISDDFQHPIILAGDFNVDQKKMVFNGLKEQGYSAAVIDAKTTLRHNCALEGYLNYPIDNIFYSDKISANSSYAIDFVKACENLTNARELSDHLPVLLNFSID